MQYNRYRMYGTVKPNYETRKRDLVSHYTANPPNRLSSAVIRCYFHEGMTLADTAEILQVSESEVEFAADMVIQDSQ